jgi:hypothetical protein
LFAQLHEQQPLGWHRYNNRDDCDSFVCRHLCLPLAPPFRTPVFYRGVGLDDLLAGILRRDRASLPPWTLPQKVYELMSGNSIAEMRSKIDFSKSSTTIATMHSIHISTTVATYDGLPRVPNSFNAIRLTVCLTALGFGFVVAILVHSAQSICGKWRCARASNQSHDGRADIGAQQTYAGCASVDR